jgi:pyruvate kinase
LRNQELADRYHFLIDALEFLSRHKTLHDNDLLAIVGGSFGPDEGASYIEFATIDKIRKRNDEIGVPIENNSSELSPIEYMRSGVIDE